MVYTVNFTNIALIDKPIFICFNVHIKILAAKFKILTLIPHCMISQKHNQVFLTIPVWKGHTRNILHTYAEPTPSYTARYSYVHVSTVTLR